MWLDLDGLTLLGLQAMKRFQGMVLTDAGGRRRGTLEHHPVAGLPLHEKPRALPRQRIHAPHRGVADHVAIARPFASRAAGAAVASVTTTMRATMLALPTGENVRFMFGVLGRPARFG